MNFSIIYSPFNELIYSTIALTGVYEKIELNIVSYPNFKKRERMRKIILSRLISAQFYKF